MKIESKSVVVSANQQDVFNYVSDLNNFKNLLPLDRIEDWDSTEDYCTFKVQGTATIDLKTKEKNPNSGLILQSGEKSPFPFTLEIVLEDVDGGTKAYQKVDAKVNPFLKMMVEKPLSNLFDFIADRLEKVFSK